MLKLVAVNGSPVGEKGDTAKLLACFLEGVKDAGATTTLLYANKIRARPCAGDMHCWYKSPGACHIRDAMQDIYPEIRGADLLVLATPVYIPLPGEMQNFINRLCPLIEPDLNFIKGRTRARARKAVRIRRIALVSTGAWWEVENFGTVVRIVEEMAADLGVEFAGSVLRPHAFLLEKAKGKAEEVLEATRRAGRQFVLENRISDDLLKTISQPLISEEELRGMFNQMNQKALSRTEGA